MGTVQDDEFPPGLSRIARLWHRLLNELDTIHREQVPLIAKELPGDVYAGNVTYTTPRGWTIQVFNDCDSWDYIEEAITPEGLSMSQALEIDYIDGGFCGTVYSPTPEEMERVWLFPPRAARRGE